MSYVLCRAHIGLLLSEKEVFLDIFGRILPEKKTVMVERKKVFLELYVYFQNHFFGFSTLLFPYAV